jgi:hypothetical protein
MKVLFAKNSGIAENHNFEFCPQKIDAKIGSSSANTSFLTKDKQKYFIRDKKTKEVIEVPRETIVCPLRADSSAKKFYLMPLDKTGKRWAAHYILPCGKLDIVWFEAEVFTPYTNIIGYSNDQLRIFGVGYQNTNNNEPHYFFKMTGQYYNENSERVAEILQSWFGYDIEVYRMTGHSPSKIYF